MTDQHSSQNEVDSPVKRVAVLPLRDVVVYPHMVIPLFVGREKSIRALDSAMAENKQILLVAQKSAEVDEPEVGDLHEIGTLGNILQLLRLPDGTIKVLVEGAQRARVMDIATTGDAQAEEDYFVADIRMIEEEYDTADKELEVLGRSALNQFEQYIKLNKKVPPEILTSLAGIDDTSRLADTIAAHMSLKLEEKQQVLEIANVRERLEHLVGKIDGEMDVLQIEKKIRGRVKQQMEKSQREYYLNEQMKAIQKELGDMEDTPNEQEDLADKIEKAGMPEEAKKKATAELNKLKMMSPMSAEATVVRSYIDWLVNVPWKKKTRVSKDLTRAEKILNEDHYGLEEVKERILEYLAVQSRVRKLKGPILCLVGPPGVGKTSLGQSIARATNRKFVRMSLGGVRDEAEIRGHRRTYIGSMPGKVIQSMRKSKYVNPLFLLDEVDKLGADFRGDPSSALLEVLDPEQNSAFNDHYLEVDYDLSNVMFVTTANTLNIPPALMDRMEIIRIAGYTEDEKVEIAKRHLIPKSVREHGLKEGEMVIEDDALLELIRRYTREAGVRNLEREIATVSRKVIKELITSKEQSITVDPDKLHDLLGVPRYRYGEAEREDRVGVVTGLAWTEFGGELLTVEGVMMPGKGRMSVTGNLRDVMKEPIQAANAYVRSRAIDFGIEPPLFEKRDIHVHVPEGATPKDGPSAGVAMVTAIVSMMTNIPVRKDVGMTGEITLRGRVLPVGGLKEKLLAALRGGLKTVVIPEENAKDLSEIPDSLKSGLDIVPVSRMDEVIKLALVRQPEPIEWDESMAPVPPPVAEEESQSGIVAH